MRYQTHQDSLGKLKIKSYNLYSSFQKLEPLFDVYCGSYLDALIKKFLSSCHNSSEKNEKEAGLRNWMESYPSVPVPEPIEPADKQANKDITRFWQGYLEIVRESAQDLGPNAIWPLEGHRPVERYITKMKEVRFDVNSATIRRRRLKEVISNNPYQILPNSRLLMVTIGEKLIKEERNERLEKKSCPNGR